MFHYLPINLFNDLFSPSLFTLLFFFPSFHLFIFLLLFSKTFHQGLGSRLERERERKS